LLAVLKTHCESLRQNGVLVDVDGLNNRLTGKDKINTRNIPTIKGELLSIRELLRNDLHTEKFVRVRPDAHDHFEQDAVFGPEVKATFPNACSDVKDVVVGLLI
jgi:hypothetical protein